VSTRGAGGLGFTRVRDLVAVGLVAAVLAYLLVSLNYGSMPVLPRLAGFVAALIGLGEAVAGLALRRRLQESRRPPEPGRATVRPVPALTAARTVMAAKATSLAGSAVAGLWLGVLAYVVPTAGDVVAASHDTTTAFIGLIGAAIMIAGALFLEHCCRTPPERPPAPPPR
jgi:hypothetical protein